MGCRIGFLAMLHISSGNAVVQQCLDTPNVVKIYFSWVLRQTLKSWILMPWCCHLHSAHSFAALGFFGALPR